MLVSIIIPVYNQEEYLRQAIESALTQDLSDIVAFPDLVNLEVIIVDDGSTDGSLNVARECKIREIEREVLEYSQETKRLAAEYLQKVGDKINIEWYKHREQDCTDRKEGREVRTTRKTLIAREFGCRIKIIQQPKNMGLSSARNAGINATHSRNGHDLILPLDADDWIESNYLKKTIPLMKDRTGVVGTWASVFGIKDYIWHTQTPTVEKLMEDNCVPVCSLIRRGTLEETGNFYNIQLKHGYEDWNLWIDILKRGWRIEILPEPLFHYREKPNSMLKDATKIRPELVTKIHSLHPDLWPPDGNRSMLDKWAGHRDATGANVAGFYGIEETYKKTAVFLDDGPVEDWGCGKAYARKFFTQPYVGVDGTPDGCDTVVDLTKYTSNTHGILLRHVLEHNFEWERVLKNALTSCEKLAIVVCTAFGDTTRLLYIDEWGIPIFSFHEEDLTKHFPSYTKEVISGEGQGQQCSETIFYVRVK